MWRDEPLLEVEPATLCATSGTVAPRREGGWHVDSGAMRAIVPGSTGRAAELVFVYRGPAAEVVPLANGELRRQLGLKLRAQDTCNVLYVMWEIEPRPHIVVSMKRNPGRSTHASCGARGYVSLKPRDYGVTPPVLGSGSGQRHTLHAEIDGRSLQVRADGRTVWEGDLPPEVFAFDGPVGMRSDNVVFDFELRVARNVSSMALPLTCSR
jgi:hypothetical protein